VELAGDVHGQLLVFSFVQKTLTGPHCHWVEVVRGWGKLALVAVWLLLTYYDAQLRHINNDAVRQLLFMSTRCCALYVCVS
jgi:hypothetical protein